MTIGIAVSGPMAGLAAFRALRAVEAVGRGAIGGFVSLVAIDAGGALVTAETQRGGGAALFDGGEPPPGIAEVRLAALMSSGPDRPEPLIQFTPADPAIGLMTGHRLPNMPGPDGRSPNMVALAEMGAGRSPAAAIEAALAADPEADAGLIAMDLAGRIALANSAGVARRDDIGEALVEDPASGLSIGVLHNSIHPHRGLAGLAVAAALDTVAPADRIDGRALLTGVPLERGDAYSLVLDAGGAAQALIVPGTEWLGAVWEGSPVRRGDPVRQGGRIVGRITREAYCISRDGVIVGARGSAEAGWTAVGDAAAPAGQGAAG